MYRSASGLLRTAGYHHYEISNYAKDGYSCAHNQTYWRNDAYYGFGMGATSYVQGQRFSRPRNRADYAQWLEAYVQQEGRIDWPTTSASDRLFETLMLGLRRSQGVNLSLLSQQFDLALVERFSTCLKSYQAQGWVILKPDGTLPTLLRQD
jgi:oxygen-independent coproporphyrinogen-3 oxidase